MNNNEFLQTEVLNAIKWEPLLKNEIIGVLANDGIVTITGNVDSLRKKHEIEDTVKCVVGVKAVIEEIEVKLNDTNKIDDSLIAIEILKVLKWNLEISNQKVRVENGWVTLEGQLKWNNQKQSAMYAVSSIQGVAGVTNNITLESNQSEIEKINIENALSRNWSVNEKDVKVNVSGNEVSLTGFVYSLYQKEQAERISWNSPGVLSVKNELIVK